MTIANTVILMFVAMGAGLYIWAVRAYTRFINRLINSRHKEELSSTPVKSPEIDSALELAKNLEKDMFNPKLPEMVGLASQVGSDIYGVTPWSGRSGTKPIKSYSQFCNELHENDPRLGETRDDVTPSPMSSSTPLPSHLYTYSSNPPNVLLTTKKPKAKKKTKVKPKKKATKKTGKKSK